MKEVYQRLRYFNVISSSHDRINANKDLIPRLKILDQVFSEISFDLLETHPDSRSVRDPNLSHSEPESDVFVCHIIFLNSHAPWPIPKYAPPKRLAT